MVMMSMIFVVMISTPQSRMWIMIIVSGAFPGAPRHPSGAEPRKFAARENAQFGTVGGKILHHFATHVCPPSYSHI